MRLEGKVVLVTGASKGIGSALALGVAKEGADVVVNYHTDAEGADRVAGAIKQMGRHAMVAGASIAVVQQIRDMFGQIRHEFGRIDVLINNAGVTGWTSLFEVTEEKWTEIIDTNLKGTFFCSLEAAKLMKEHGGGSIVNISTSCAARGVKNLAVYAASKGAIHALTRQLAVELAPYKIRVNTFAPGATLVERNLRDDPNYDRTWGSVVPLGRSAAPQEMVGAAVYLASDESSYMTGQVFYVDGGWTVAGTLPGTHMDQVLERNR